MLLLVSQVSPQQAAGASIAQNARGIEERRNDRAAECASALRVAQIDQRGQTGVVCKIAAGREDLEGAFGLIHRVYVRSGLARPNACLMRVTPYQLLPTTEVFVAKAQDRVIATLSLVRDGDLGLPMEAIYAEEVADFRRRGIRVGEVSCLASEEPALRHSLPVVMRLMSLMAQCAERRGVHRLLIAVHPRHVKFYQALTAFEPIGGEKLYDCVLGKPAVAMALNLDRAPVEHCDLYRKFFGVPFPEEAFRPHPIPPALRSELELVAEVSYDAALPYQLTELVA